MASLSYLCLRYNQLRRKLITLGLTTSEDAELARVYTALYERNAFGDHNA